MNINEIKGLSLDKILTDLKLEKAQLEEAVEPHTIDFHKSFLQFDDIQYSYEIDLSLYKKLCGALVEVFSHYKDVLGDDIYYVLNKRTNNESVVDLAGTQCVIVKQWKSDNGSIRIHAYHLMSDSFRGFVFETGGQWLIGLRYNKKSWEYYASRQRCSEIALFPYFADLFATGEIKETKASIKLAEIFDKSFPDWYPLVKCTNLG